jgi:PAS domain S-box-containing protein/diguanylate cyclase (GGDEF)-like protein
MPELPEPDVYRAVLESLPQGIYMVDRDRKILLWNDGAERVTGYLRHEVIGRSCQSCLQQFCAESDVLLCSSSCPLSNSLRDGRLVEADLFIRHKDGSRVPVRSRVAPVRDVDGVIIGAATTLEEHIQLTGREVYVHTRAVRDALDESTGLPDRKSIELHLAAVLEDIREDQLPFGVLAIQVDRLPELGHSHGIKAVEAMARVVGRTLAKNLHQPDIVGHWSEGRFIAVLTDCPASALPKAAGMLQRIISLVTLPWWGDRVGVTISIGGTAGRAADTAEVLAGRAEEALENALLADGGQVHII